MASAPKHPVEYRLLVEHTEDELLKRKGILFLLETTKQFTNFTYHIDVRDSFEGRSLRWTLHGLKAPSMNMPQTGTAQFARMYEEVPKTVRFTLSKNDAVSADAELKIGAATVTLAAQPDGFLKVYTDRALFERNRLADSRPPEPKPDLRRNPAPAPAKRSTTRKKR